MIELLKKVFIAFVLLLVAAGVQAQDITWNDGVEVSSLTLVGKAFDTPNPYDRIDTVRYKGFDKTENTMCRQPSGLAVLFRTDATDISVSLEFGERNSSSYRAYRGVDLYIMKDGRWTWAGMNDFPAGHNDPTLVKSIVKNMDGAMKECILYLPLRAEVYSCKIYVPQCAKIEAVESPFRHKIVFHGSSFTQGVGCGRAGMSYPAQFMRRTGMQIIPLGFAGRCMMQPYFADVLEDIEADAYVFDTFSNPDGEIIKERLLPFIERMVKAHPGKPMIFQRTIYWEWANFNLEAQSSTEEKQAASDSLMRIACKMYKDVYYIAPDAALHNGESSTADGIHPNDNGYSIWERSIEKPILKILRKYGIK